MSGMSGSDMYFGAGSPPSPPQAQQPAYTPPPFPGADQMGYPDFGAYGYGRGAPKFPPMPPHPQQPAAPAPAAGQDKSRAAPGPAPYGKPPGPTPGAQPPMPPMPGYGMPPYMPPYSMYGMYGMYGGMQGMPTPGYDAETPYSAPGFDANKFGMAAAYYNPGYPPPGYNMPPYGQMRPPWGPYPGMGQGMPPQDPSKYGGGQAAMGQNKVAPAPAAASNPNARARGFGDRSAYQPGRYDQPPHFPPYYPPQAPSYNSYYQPHQQPHHQQPGPQ